MFPNVYGLLVALACLSAPLAVAGDVVYTVNYVDPAAGDEGSVIPSSLNTTTTAAVFTRMAVAAATGLLNKHLNRPAAAIILRATDKLWVKLALDSDPLLANAEEQPVSGDELVHAAVEAGAVKGVVLFNPKETWAIPTVVTLCGVLEAIPVTDASQVQNLPVLFDARGKWSDNLDSTRYQIDSVLPKTNTTYLIVQSPNLLMDGWLVDYAVSTAALTIWMDDNMCVPLSKSHALFGAIVDDHADHWTHPRGPGGALLPLPVMGYFGVDGAIFEVLQDCTDSHTLASLVSDFCPSLSFYGRLSPAKLPLQQPPLQVEPAYDASKAYVTIVMSDGDNLQFDLGETALQVQRRLLRCDTAAKRADKKLCPPLVWTVSNRLIDYAPHVLSWFYDSANMLEGTDTYLMGPSGYTYAWPSYYSNDLQNALSAATTNAMQQLDMQAFVDWEFSTLGSNRAGTLAYLEKVAPPGTEGAAVFVSDAPALTGGAAWNLPPRTEQDVAIFTQACLGSLCVWNGQSPATVANVLNKLQPGTMSYIYPLAATSLDDISAMMAQLNARVSVVGHRELLALFRQKYACSTDAATMCGKDRLDVNEEKSNSKARLVMQGDGNLVLYNSNSKVVWASSTSGAGNYAQFQNDGNFVVYASNGKVKWAINRQGGSHLVLQEDCNLVVYDPDGRVKWASGSKC